MFVLFCASNSGSGQILLYELRRFNISKKKKNIHGLSWFFLLNSETYLISHLTCDILALFIADFHEPSFPPPGARGFFFSYLNLFFKYLDNYSSTRSNYFYNYYFKLFFD